MKPHNLQGFFHFIDSSLTFKLGIIYGLRGRMASQILWNRRMILDGANYPPLHFICVAKLRGGRSVPREQRLDTQGCPRSETRHRN